MGFKRRWNQKDGKQIDMCRNSGIVAIFDDLQNSSQVRKNIMKKLSNVECKEVIFSILK